MSKCLIEQSSLTAIGDAIRSKGGTNEQFTIPEGMVNAIRDLQTGISGVSGDMITRSFTRTKEEKEMDMDIPEYLELPEDPNKLGIAIAAVWVERMSGSGTTKYGTEQLLYIIHDGCGDYIVRYFGHKPAEGYFGIYDPLDNPNVQNTFKLIYRGPSENAGYSKYQMGMNYAGNGYPYKYQSITTPTEDPYPDKGMSHLVDYYDWEFLQEDFIDIEADQNKPRKYRWNYSWRRTDVDAFKVRGLFAVEVV